MFLLAFFFFFFLIVAHLPWLCITPSNFFYYYYILWECYLVLNFDVYFRHSVNLPQDQLDPAKTYFRLESLCFRCGLSSLSVECPRCSAHSLHSGWSELQHLRVLHETLSCSNPRITVPCPTGSHLALASLSLQPKTQEDPLRIQDF